jgi:hypothetical protein
MHVHEKPEAENIMLVFLQIYLFKFKFLQIKAKLKPMSLKLWRIEMKRIGLVQDLGILKCNEESLDQNSQGKKWNEVK